MREHGRGEIYMNSENYSLSSKGHINKQIERMNKWTNKERN